MILATTEASALPATIISRCQRFDFKRLSNDDVIERLIEVCEVEEIEAEPAVLEMIARTAWGSLRDAENLLDQLSSQTQTIEALAKAVEASTLVLEAKQESFRAGIETNLNVLDAQRDLFQAGFNYNSAKYDTLILILQLEQTAGNLSDSHLGVLNAMLVPPTTN